MTETPFTLDKFAAARQRIAPYVRHTPMLPAPLLHRDGPHGLQLKLENMQIAGSFKVRGAFNTLLSLEPEQQQRGVVASSGGNHGLAVACAAQRLGIPATIYLPATATPDRVERIRQFGVDLVTHGTSWDEAHARALAHAEADGLAYVHPFDDPRTVIGQGTLALEMLADVPDLDCVLIAIGGGGLIAGMAAVLKQSRPQIRIIGVELPPPQIGLSAFANSGWISLLTAHHGMKPTPVPLPTPKQMDWRMCIRLTIRVP